MVGNLSSFAVIAATDGLIQFAQGSVRASGELDLLRTGLRNIEGSSEAAAHRLEELDAVARLPGANLTALVRYSNRLRSIGLTAEETDAILRGVGQSVVVMGGDAHIATEALEQISQALQQNIVDMRDFRPIIQRVPGFLQAVADVHGVEPTLDGMRDAVDALGGSVKDALLPVLANLEQRFAAPPPESYVRSIDELHNSFFLFQATLGDLVLPTVASAARHSMQRSSMPTLRLGATMRFKTVSDTCVNISKSYRKQSGTSVSLTGVDGHKHRVRFRVSRSNWVGSNALKSGILRSSGNWQLKLRN